MGTPKSHNAMLALLDTLPLAPESACSYFPDRKSRVREFQYPGNIPDSLFDAAMGSGYRRCGDMYYKTACRGCRLCIAFRIPVANFQPTRSQRRILKRNSDVETRVVMPESTFDKMDLYVTYKFRQHHLKPLSPDELEQEFDPDHHLQVMQFQMYTNPDTSRELNLVVDDELIGFGTLDLVGDSLSAVYFVFNHDFADRSPGSLAIMRGIQWAQENGFRYYHLGYFIPGHPKMDYKRKFGPSEFLNADTGEWEPFSDAALARYLS